jgi:hypothetical protein
MTDSNVVELKAPTQDALGELLKMGARQLLAQAVEVELAENCCPCMLIAWLMADKPLSATAICRTARFRSGDQCFFRFDFLETLPVGAMQTHLGRT